MKKLESLLSKRQLKKLNKLVEKCNGSGSCMSYIINNPDLQLKCNDQWYSLGEDYYVTVFNIIPYNKKGKPLYHKALEYHVLVRRHSDRASEYVSLLEVSYCFLEGILDGLKFAPYRYYKVLNPDCFKDKQPIS